MANREDIINRIRAMRAKAEDSAASESEAMAAAEMAARMLVKHDITPEELKETKKLDGVVQGFKQGKFLHPVANRVGYQIGVLTETKPIVMGSELKFVGLEEDVLMAVYLTEMLVGAGKRAWVAASEERAAGVPFKVLNGLRESFFAGFGARVSQRLKELAEFRKQQRTKSQDSGHGSALVVVKEAIIAAKLKEMGIVVRKARRQGQKYFDPDAYQRGFAEGSKPNLGRPFGSDMEKRSLK